MARVFETHVEGLGFPEGPVALPDGSIAFVDLLHARVCAYGDGALRVLADNVPGAPNGMRLGPDGALYICNNGGLAPEGHGRLKHAKPQIDGCLMRLTMAGALTTHTGALPGGKPSRPNDLVVTPEGALAFTDPQNWEAEDADYLGGQLLLAAPDGSVTRLRSMTGFPNGLCFHPDGSLIVAITRAHRFVKFRWNAGAALDAPQVWAQLDDGFNPDGMVLHGDRFYAAGSVGDRIAVLALDGTLIEMIDCPSGSDPTNLCVHDDRLWVTLGFAGQLVSTPL
ncbi:SMP-30/gluconolactonase/LRE family protein [Pukyongiella litopenaei]|uniref:SMP-30/gluconolactonase/LRE family protein n=1 Tax=Pukyongiella litopenaei TaxID=2605946 RepID=A0A2S0MQS5_9RHOB|nr:SMP-30/gluconolactonase/LRE family protein [Pukyongiella litopenaei]AVO38222.1 SMP-30/gluconolactonase/LRE family protein [Pukyongiella litopenaei]